MKAMEHPQGEGVKGFLLTFVLFITSKILWLLDAVTIAQLASAATLISAVVVAIANAPKAIQAVKDFLNKRKK